MLRYRVSSAFPTKALVFRVPLALGLLLGACESSGEASPAEPPLAAPVATQPSAPITAAPPGAAKSAPSAAPASECEELCSATRSVRCGMGEPECVKACSQMLELPVCVDKMQAFLRCAAKQPVESFECDDGMASLKSEACQSEQAAVASCLGGQ